MKWGETVLIWPLCCCRFRFSGTENLFSVRALLLRVRIWKPLSLSSFLILSFAHVCGWSILGFAGWIYSCAVRHESTFLGWMKIWEMHRVRCLLLLFGPFLDTCFSLQTRGFVFSSPLFLKSPWARATFVLIYLMQEWPLGSRVSGCSNILW